MDFLWFPTILKFYVKQMEHLYLSTIGVTSSALTNIVLDYIFVVKLNYGVAGAAFATGLSQVLSTIIFFSYFLSKKSKLKFTKFKFNLSELKEL